MIHILKKKGDFAYMLQNGKVAVIDDDALDRKLLKECAEIVFSHVDCYASVHSFYVAKKTYDLVVLDIELDGEDGIEASKTIASNCDYIMFATNLPDKVWKAFGQQVVAFVLKKDGKGHIVNEMRRVRNEYLCDQITLETADGIMKVDARTIEAIIIENRQIHCLYANQGKVRLRNHPLDYYESQYNGVLVRLNHYMLVNPLQMKRIQGNECWMLSGNNYRIGRKWLQDVRTAYAGRAI